MPHETGLIATVSIALALAFAGGFIATRLRLPAIVGYLLAGVAVGPFTPGFVADAELAPQLAEIGVILLMFGVGIHFSVRDLLAVRSVAVPGAVGQIAAATALSVAVAAWWGWGLGAGLVLGLAVSVASTVVLLRALLDRNELDSLAGRVAVGWLIVEDLFTVLALVLLPALAAPLGGEAVGGLAVAAGGGDLVLTLALTLGKVALLGALMFFGGARAVPWLLAQVARTGSRELFTLAVLTVALGIAYGAAVLFGVSFALGAFLAGLVVGESDLSHQAAADALPLRDAFAVLFFVSVGMLFDPAILVTNLGHVLTVLALIVVAKPLAAFLIVAFLGHPVRTGLVVAAGLAQIGEFSFILAELGRSLGLLPQQGYSLVLAGALLSITLNPLLFRAVGPVETWLRRRPRLAALLGGRAAARAARALPPLPSAATAAGGGGGDDLAGHAVLCGYGRVGSLVGEALGRQGVPYVAVDQDRRLVEALRRRGIRALYGDAADRALLDQAALDEARLLVVAIPDPLATRHVVEEARRRNPALAVVVRTHSEAERAYLSDGRADEAVLGEHLLAQEIARLALERVGRAPAADVEGGASHEIGETPPSPVGQGAPRPAVPEGR
jgi:monovalent cation:H+ antiporter-2, CPA2 family